MAAGEYVSVSSQSDTKQADLGRERLELATSPDANLEELAGIDRARGLDADIARTVATQMTAFVRSAPTPATSFTLAI